MCIHFNQNKILIKMDFVALYTFVIYIYTIYIHTQQTNSSTLGNVYTT